MVQGSLFPGRDRTRRALAAGRGLHWCFFYLDFNVWHYHCISLFFYSIFISSFYLFISFFYLSFLCFVRMFSCYYFFDCVIDVAGGNIVQVLLKAATYSKIFEERLMYYNVYNKINKTKKTNTKKISTENSTLFVF